jgi:hypothetical protein
MSTEDFIIELFCRVDDKLKTIKNHPQATLAPSELVTIALLFALKGVSGRAFYRWLKRDYPHWFPRLPDRTRLFRRLQSHWKWAQLFLGEPSLLGIMDTYGIELIHPVREGRNPDAWVGKGISNHRWIVGGKLALVVNHLGEIIGWACAPANAHDNWFQPLPEAFTEQSVILADTGVHAKEGDPPNLKICKRGQWNERMLIETIHSMLTVVCHTKKMRHRLFEYFKMHLGFMVAAFNTLISWFGLKPNHNGFVPLSIADFSL